ncbi:unnamed protein product, partial [Sphacelaria rigidula]
PPLSLPSSREDADRERERSRRHDRDRTSINHHGGGLGSNRRRSSLDGEYDGDLAGMRGDERKSVSLSPRTYTADDNRHEEESNVGRVEAGIGVVGSSSLHPLGDGVDAG